MSNNSSLLDKLAIDVHKFLSGFGESDIRTSRTFQTRVLGHSIEKVQTVDEAGSVSEIRYEVVSPRDNRVIGSFSHCENAQWFVLSRELKKADLHIAQPAPRSS